MSVVLGRKDVFERIALTKAQIKEFGLEHLKNPDPDVLMKLKRDPNWYSFVVENGDLYQIEIDALQKDPERFKELVLLAVDKYFDQRVYDAVMTEFTPEYIDKLVGENVQFTEDDGDTRNDDV